MGKGSIQERLNTGKNRQHFVNRISKQEKKYMEIHTRTNVISNRNESYLLFSLRLKKN